MNPCQIPEGGLRIFFQLVAPLGACEGSRSWACGVGILGFIRYEGEMGSLLNPKQKEKKNE